MMEEDARITTMAEAMRTDVDGSAFKSRLYDVSIDIKSGTQTQAFNREFIKALSAAAAHNIQCDERTRVDLYDMEDVKARLVEYVQACAVAGLLPTMSGLCGWSFKCSRAWISKFKRQNPQHPTTQLLDSTSEVFADCLINSSLANATNSIMSLFVLKNCGGYVDKPEPEAEEPVEAEEAALDAAAIAARYATDV